MKHRDREERAVVFTLVGDVIECMHGVAPFVAIIIIIIIFISGFFFRLDTNKRTVR